VAKFKTDAMWGIGAHALQALGNLGVGLILLKVASKTEYGLYGVGTTLILQGIGVGNALVIMPLNIFAPTKSREIRDKFCSSLLLIVILILIPLIALSLSTLTLFSATISAEYLEIFYISGIALAGVLLLEFFRVYFYVENSPKSTFFLEAALFTSVLTGLTIAIYTDFTNLHQWAIGLRGIFAFLLAAFAWFITRSISIKAAVGNLHATLKETMPHSAWSLGGVLMSSLQSQFWIYLLAYSWGADHVAEVLAAFILLSPINVISNSIWRVFLPRMTKWKHEGDTRLMLSFAKKVLGLLILSICIYAGIILILFDKLSGLIVSNEYTKVKELLVLCILYLIANYFRTMSTNLLQIYKRFKQITLTNSITSVLVFVCSLAVVYSYQAEGLIIIMAGGELLLGILLYLGFQKARLETSNHF
jgi:O-antigen/teichoic acid export membrane protein